MDIRSCAMLSNGKLMPMLGFGTWQLEQDEARRSVLAAIEQGYRHIDTAAAYHNEEGVGQGIRESAVPREEIFLTTKLWNTEHGYDKTLRAFDESLKRLGTEYVDLYLIHWPKPLRNESWKALERIYKEGRAKAIGVSNFHQHHLEELIADCEIAPMVNQIEFHPYLVQEPLLTFCREHQIQYEAWSPLMRGRMLSEPLIMELAKAYGKTPSQIILRWDLQMGVVTIPKSSSESRMQENMDIFDFELSAPDMKRILQLDRGERSGSDPDHFNF